MANQNFQLPSGQNVFPYSESYSGLPQQYRDRLMETIMPSLNSSISNRDSNIDNYFNNAMGSYQQQLQNTLKTNVPRTVNNLANRGILSSTVASDALGKTQTDAYRDFSNKGYQTAMQSALLKSQQPQVLGNLAQLGNYSSSYTEDKTALYRKLAEMLMSL